MSKGNTGGPGRDVGSSRAAGPRSPGASGDRDASGPHAAPAPTTAPATASVTASTADAADALEAAIGDGLDVDATMRGTRVMVLRTVFLYGLALAILIVVDVLSSRLGDPLFVHVPFASAAPILAVGATVAIGLHVAVFNLTHDKPEASFAPDVLARLDAFATGGFLVGLAAAAAGWLTLWPVGPTVPTGLDVLGAVVSVVVVVLAGMAGHIVPARAFAALERARHVYNLAWLTRAADYWALSRPPTIVGTAFLAVVCAGPALGLAWAVGQFSSEAAVAGSVWVGLIVLPPLVLVVGLVLLVHRRYWFSAGALLAGPGLAAWMVALMVREVEENPSALAFLACALFTWGLLSVSLLPPPASRRVPHVSRVLRHVVAWSLRIRLKTMTRRSRQRRGLGWPGLVTWFNRATGREASSAGT